MTTTTHYTDADVAKVVEQTKREILADIGVAVSSRGDVMPATISTFSELHDYVDANTYGGLCDEDSPYHYLWDISDDNGTPLAIDFAIAVQNVVHEWLQAGRP